MSTAGVFSRRTYFSARLGLLSSFVAVALGAANLRTSGVMGGGRADDTSALQRTLAAGCALRLPAHIRGSGRMARGGEVLGPTIDGRHGEAAERIRRTYSATSGPNPGGFVHAATPACGTAVSCSTNFSERGSNHSSV